MPALLGTCSPFSSEHQPCLNCIALDLGPLWCMCDTPVALRINTDSLVAFQLKCPKQKGNWIAVCQSNVRPRALFGCVWYMRGSGFVETGLDGYTGQRKLNMCLSSPYLYMRSSPWSELDHLANKYTWISPGKELMVRSKRKLQDPTSMQRSWSEDPEVSWGFPSFHQRTHIYSFFFSSIISNRWWPLAWQKMLLLLSIDQINANYCYIFFNLNWIISQCPLRLFSVAISSLKSSLFPYIEYKITSTVLIQWLFTEEINLLPVCYLQIYH